jgi:hypothetical protein
MSNLDAILAAAEAALRELDPAFLAPSGWKAHAAAGDARALLLDVLRTSYEVRGRALQGIARADAGLADLLGEWAPLLAASADSQEKIGNELPAAPAAPAGIEVIPAASEAEPTPDPTGAPDAAGHPSASALEGMNALVPMAKDLPIDAADLAFIPKSLEMVAGLSPQDVDQEAKILYNCVWQLEGLFDRYARGASHPASGSAYVRFVEALAARKEALAARLAQIGFRLSPREAAGAWTDIKAAVGEDAAVALPVFSDRKSGTVAGIRRSGVRSERGLVEKAQVLVSQGPSEASAALEAAMAGLLATRPADPKDRSQIGRGIKEIHKLLGALPAQPDGYTFARFAVNALNDLDSGNRLTGAIRNLVAYLEKGGFQEILVPLGETFDESFSPGKYERKKVPSDRPKDKIVGILQRGFLDSKGICIQKAVVAISKG